MKILHVISNFIPGGAEVQVLNWVSNSEKNIDYTIAAKKENYDEVFLNKFRKVSINNLYFPLTTYKTFKLLRDNKFEIVHVHTMYDYFIWYMFKLIFDFELIIHSHTSNSGFGRKGYIKNMITPVKLRFGTTGIGCTEESINYFFNRSKNCYLLPNSINVYQFRFSKDKRLKIRKNLGFDKDDFVLISVANLSPVKNHKFLLNILKILPKNYKLLIVGDGELKTELLSLIEDLNLSSRVIMLGRRDQNEISALLSASDIFLLPSLYEGLPLSILEAQANGINCISFFDLSENAVINSNLYRLELSVEKWGEFIILISRDLKRISDQEIEANFKKRLMDVKDNTDALLNIYGNILKRKK